MSALPQTAPDIALQQLLEGNERFASGRPAHPRQDAQQRAALLGVQRPIAAILGCSDSRVPPEILFDQGIGDLFVVRTAGNIVDDVVMGSLEYAVEHLGVALILVLGHQGCGAVTAAASGVEAPGHIADLVKCIDPAIARAITETQGQVGELVPNAILENVRLAAACLACCEPLLEPYVKSGKLTIQPAYYSLEEGRVHLL